MSSLFNAANGSSSPIGTDVTLSLPVSSSSSSSYTQNLSKSQLERTEQNRLKALKIRQAKLAATSPTSLRTTNTTTTISGPDTGNGQAMEKAAFKDPSDKPKANRKRKEIDLTYCDYNFTTMKDSRGGFLIEEEDPGISLDKRRKEDEAKKPQAEPPLNLDLAENPQCDDCKSLDLDFNLVKHFALNVCKKCKEDNADKYSLLTKTEVKQDYLLTDSELRDEELLPRWQRPNPHKSSWSDMQLFLRCQVEVFAWEKWGSEAALDAEFDKREQEKKDRKEKKFKEKLKELRKKTRTSTWRRKEDVHTHTFGPKVWDEDEAMFSEVCTDCKFIRTFEEF